MKNCSKFLLTLLLLQVALGLCSCAGEAASVEPEKFRVSTRQLPPEPVYSRLTWSHLPSPIRPKSVEETPYILPVVQFDMPRATLDQAIEALAQSMGYRWEYPSGVAKRRIEIRMEGTVEEVLREINRQAGVLGVFDHSQRMVKIIDTRTVPRLPGT